MSDSIETVGVLEAAETAQHPLLSICLIFRNDIRSIERCLQALQPLRDTIPCELVMADTGSIDGSREIVERYADVVFNFPWIDDFAAARNAVMKRCTGEWYLTVDTDEYLDENIDALVDFLRGDNQNVMACQINIRNYSSYEMNDSYSDFYSMRIVRRSSGAHYVGAVHESWAGFQTNGAIITLPKVIFHHDGYVNMGQNPAKLERNMSLLRQKLRKDQRNLLIRLQIIESGFQEPDHLDQLRKAVTLVRRKSEGWQTFGPPIFRHAVSIARQKKLPELKKWAEQAVEWFPDSYYTRIDVAMHMATEAIEQKDYEECIRLCTGLLEAYADYFAGRGDMGGLAVSTMQYASPYQERNVRIILANAYLETGRPEKAFPLLAEFDCSTLDQLQTNNYSNNLCLLHSRSDLDTSELIRAVWEGMTKPEPSKEKADIRRGTFLLIGSIAFSDGLMRTERLDKYFHRPAYTLFLPLSGECPLGSAAAMLETRDPQELAALLGTVEKWGELSMPALIHALDCGMPFPLPDRPMGMEEMDYLAGRLAQDKVAILRIAENAADTAEGADWQRLDWTRSLALGSVQNFDWATADTCRGMSAARMFARVESVFLPRCYTAEVLREENLSSLPPMHRFGWYCVRAFQALDGGDTTEYVRALRSSLAVCEQMKAMVEFLMEHTPQLQAAKYPGELMALAEKVRSMLAIYPPDDPAVEIIKQSPAYQKVAHLIEGPDLGMLGGLKQ